MINHKWVLFYLVTILELLFHGQAIRIVFELENLLYQSTRESVECLMTSLPLQETSLVEFIRLNRNSYVDMRSFYRPNFRTLEILEGLEDGSIPKSIINEVLRFSDFGD